MRRHVDRLGTVLPASVYNHVSVREGAALPTVPR